MNDTLKWLIGCTMTVIMACGGMLRWIFRGHEDRIRQLEIWQKEHDKFVNDTMLRLTGDLAALQKGQIMIERRLGELVERLDASFQRELERTDPGLRRRMSDLKEK